MTKVSGVLYAKLVIIFGISLWLTIAIFNNFTDQITNRVLLSTMLDMHLMINDPNQLGSGLLWRAMPSFLSKYLLWLVIFLETLVTIYLWKSFIDFSKAIFLNKDKLQHARNTVIKALTCFMIIWLIFMIGGFWFGYWIKQGAIQHVHMTLLIISITSISFISNKHNEE